MTDQQQKMREEAEHSRFEAAKMAMQGLLSSDDKTQRRLSEQAAKENVKLKTLIAKLSIEYADELLTQLSRKK